MNYPVQSDIHREITDLLQEKLPGALISQELALDLLNIEINVNQIHDALSLMHTQLGFTFLTTLCGMHLPEKNQLGVVYHLHHLEKNSRIRVKTFVDLKWATVDSICDIFPAANWMERETYDFFGIKFQGHPNLKRILNVGDMTDFPLRKDFPLEDATREDKNDSFFGR